MSEEQMAQIENDLAYLKTHYDNVAKTLIIPNTNSLGILFNYYAQLNNGKQKCFSCRSDRAFIMKYFKQALYGR